MTTIVTLSPRDPMVLALSKALNLSRAEAYMAAAETWAWITEHAIDGAVPNTEPDALDVATDIPGIGVAMVDIGMALVDAGGVKLPDRLRLAVRGRLDDVGQRGTALGAVREDRRRQQNREAAARCRRKKKEAVPRAAPVDKPWRSIGRVAGHEVVLAEGPYGMYATVQGAAVGGEKRKLSAGNKLWTLDGTTLADVAPDILRKWKAVHDGEAKVWDESKRRPLTPTYSALVEAFGQAVGGAKKDSAIAAARAAGEGGDGRQIDDDADASSSSSCVSNRQHDRQQSSAFLMMTQHSNSLQQGVCGDDDADDDALSSSMSSFQRKEDMQITERQTSWDVDREGRPLQEWERNQREAKRTIRNEKVATALGMPVNELVAASPKEVGELRQRLIEMGIDPRTGDSLQHGISASRKPR